MGRQSRQSRQSRRAQQRRQQARGRGRQHPQFSQMRGQFWAGIAIVVAAAALFAYFALRPSSTSSATATPTPQFPEGPRVAMVHCDQGMTSANSYHVHAHLEVYRAGKPEIIPATAGHYPDYDCSYWLHAHDTAGIIHIESPSKIVPKLATWFEIIRRTTGKAPDITPGPGQTMRVWVDEKPYNGDPLQIGLTAHKDITIEVGPPWVKPKKFNYGTL